MPEYFGRETLILREELRQKPYDHHDGHENHDDQMRLLNQMIKAMKTSRGHLERLPTLNESENQDILEFLKDYETNPHYSNWTNRELMKKTANVFTNCLTKKQNLIFKKY